jgi:DNA-3-methyladenine glycosylase I
MGRTQVDRGWGFFTYNEQDRAVQAMKDYRAIFDGVESTLIRVGTQNLPESQIRAKLNKFREVEGRRFSNGEIYRILVEVVFYSGFRAATVTDKLDVIHRHFPDYQTVARYGQRDTTRILSDPAMIRNRRKVWACIRNAQTLQCIVREHGSFQAYVDTFSARASYANLLRLKGELQHGFSHLGKITAYHFLMEIGMPVLKPDRVICRIFHRLGLVESEDHAEQVVEEGRKFAEATGHPIRYIDIVFVAYGQARSPHFGLEKGICLGDDPNCGICGVSPYCSYDSRDPAARTDARVVEPASPTQHIIQEGDLFIHLPHGGSGSGFRLSQLVDYVQRSGRDYIIQAQQQCKLREHTKPHSLDVWLRKNHAAIPDTAQAVNSVMRALEATGRFEIVQKLVCPDTGRKCKGLKLVNTPAGD